MPEVALVGVGGYGAWHLRNLERLRQAGEARLAAACDPIPAARTAELGPVPVYGDLDELLARHRIDVTVIASPIPTHARLAATALRAGTDVLLEKPPVTSSHELSRLRALAAETGRSVQVGFQSLGSHALPALTELIGSGALGAVTGIGGAGVWVRPFEYYRRAPWAGRRLLNGEAVVDGTLTNPFAHAVATAFAVAQTGSPERTPDGVEVELYRAHDIEADDTACLRARFGGSAAVVVATTVCGPRDQDPYVVVHGEEGRAVLHYERDRLTVESRESGTWRRTYGRTDLLEDLLAHVADGRSTPLLAPLHRSGAFTAVVDAVRQAQEVRRVPPRYWRDDAGRNRVIHGIDEFVRRAAEDMALFSEQGIEWASGSTSGE
ncbi:putative dehydrogenase [Saccharopolyspora erythraea NRRL 2338]|uniref:Gfo/Idh/MocA family oxidoreductase n=1 Tax=Saccharopolyspora erythraea TaxID=1836 RepID=A0ABN1E599_SACER|nr:putative dehydrogenase [Saccharopolyspora erythraea NRRL 2338]QRK87908.1 Gfo/Idh/MocA family oxidoreductase [Saccharopolyspora erythraea]